MNCGRAIYGNAPPALRSLIGMALNQSEFLRRSKIVHGEYYDYTNSKFEGVHKKVVIICPVHGEFEQTPHDHFRGRGCKKCWLDKISKPLHGVGINDLHLRYDNPAYIHWLCMLSRCYCQRRQKDYPAYIGCSVCDEWHILSNFKKWFDENYIEGYHLDKDILVKGNKVYSPDTCCFVPHEINNITTNSKRVRGLLPIGVVFRKNKYVTSFSCTRNGTKKRKHIGYFSTPEEAFEAYKTAKEAYIKEVAQEYYSNNKITKRVYDALINYQIEITD